MPRRRNQFIRELLARPFSEEWETWLSGNMAHYRLLSEAERERLRNDAKVLVAEKSWEGCDGLKVTELMKLTVAAEAALLLLGLEHDYFSRVLSIVLFPAAFELPAESWQERGTTVAGRAVDYGTVYLSWESVLAEARDPTLGHNLVIHEFTHQLDFLDGYTNGVPPLRSRDQTRRWQEVMRGDFNRLRHDLQKGRGTFLGSYAATNPTEFFSVASEKFFSLPAQLRQRHPELFEVLAEYYRVDPVRWFQGKAGVEIHSATSSSAGQAPDVRGLVTPPRPAEPDFVDFACPYCGNPVSFPPAEAGSLKQCPTCLEAMIVPERSGVPAVRIPHPISTDRLSLRRFQTLDADDLSGLMSNEDILRYLEWTAMTLEQTEEWIAAQRNNQFPQANRYYYFAIESNHARKVIGLIAFWLPYEEFDVAQFEIIIHPDWQRQGYGTEVLRGLFAYVFAGLHVRRLLARCDSRNVAARALLAKSGMRQESECLHDRFVKGQWVNTLGFALLREEYESRSKRALAG